MLFLSVTDRENERRKSGEYSRGSYQWSCSDICIYTCTHTLALEFAQSLHLHCSLILTVLLFCFDEAFTLFHCFRSTNSCQLWQLQQPLQPLAALTFICFCSSLAHLSQVLFTILFLLMFYSSSQFVIVLSFCQNFVQAKCFKKKLLLLLLKFICECFQIFLSFHLLGLAFQGHS